MRHIFLLSLLSWGTLCGVTAWAGPHTVQRGETYQDLSTLYHLSVATLKKANHNAVLHVGETVEVPSKMLFYDLGSSTLFRQVSNPALCDKKKADTFYNKGAELKQKMKGASISKMQELTPKVTECFQMAVSYGSLEALYQLGYMKLLGRYKLYGKPEFGDVANQNKAEFTDGIEMLQIAALLGHQSAFIELAMACAYHQSPIYNPYLCLEMLRLANDELGIDTREKICDMYERGLGINRDYMQAYLYSPDPELASTSSEYDCKKASIIHNITIMKESAENAKYGVGLPTKTLLSVAMSHVKDSKIDAEGLFWLHLAAEKGDPDANWIMAGVLHDEKSRTVNVGRNPDKQMLYFIKRAAKAGHKEAGEYITAYNKVEEAKRQRREEEEKAIAEQERQRKETNRQMWCGIFSTLFQAGTQAYIISQQQHHSGGGSYNYPSTSPQWEANNMLALQQLAQYTVNQGIAAWTGTPMVPTDMSAVNFGTDMTPGSPAWMFQQQQQVNRIAMQNARMSCEQLSALKRQADMIETQLINNPTQPIAGYYDQYGNWNSAEMVAAGISSNAASSVSSGSTDTGSSGTQSSYIEDRYGYRTCRQCAGTGSCRSCNGTGHLHNNLGTGDISPCPNCWKENGSATGRCYSCRGTGSTYGLK